MMKKTLYALGTPIRGATTRKRMRDSKDGEFYAETDHKYIRQGVDL